MITDTLPVDRDLRQRLERRDAGTAGVVTWPTVSDDDLGRHGQLHGDVHRANDPGTLTNVAAATTATTDTDWSATTRVR